MNRITDLVISTQIATIVAALLTYWAHLIENGTVLNANWHFMIYILLASAVVFMLFPHLVAGGKGMPTQADMDTVNAMKAHSENLLASAEAKAKLANLIRTRELNDVLR